MSASHRSLTCPDSLFSLAVADHRHLIPVLFVLGQVKDKCRDADLSLKEPSSHLPFDMVCMASLTSKSGCHSTLVKRADSDSSQTRPEMQPQRLCLWPRPPELQTLYSPALASRAHTQIQSANLGGAGSRLRAQRAGIPGASVTCLRNADDPSSHLVCWPPL